LKRNSIQLIVQGIHIAVYTAYCIPLAARRPGKPLQKKKGKKTPEQTNREILNQNMAL
jgi:hypothetical protein